ncbi:MAG: DUF4271 domain-containing protein [Bacteroidota bacterium]|nr:DUF4271 domain-containing protein [Bacteroidota bacterium]
MPAHLIHIQSQDTLKSPLIVPDNPVGRVEEFYEFGAPEILIEEKKENKPDPKKEIKAKTEKTKEKTKIQEQVVKQINATENALQSSELNEKGHKTIDSSSIQVQEFKQPEFSYFHLTDTIVSGFGQTYKIESKKEIYTNTTHSLFKEHILKPKNYEPIFIQRKEDGLIGAFLVILCLLSVIKVAYFKKFKQYLTSFFNLRFNIQMLHQEKAVNEQVYSIMLVASLLITTTFLYQAISHYGLSIDLLSDSLTGYLYFKILALVFIAIILKIVLIKISGFILNSSKLTSDYIFNLILFFNMLNIILLPVIIGIQYVNLIPIQIFFVLGGAIATLTFAFMLQRLYVLGNSQQGTSSYYIFLYLCTLEILPLILLSKLLI